MLLVQRSKYGDSLVTRNGNSSVTSQRTKHFSVKSVLRLVNAKITSTMLRMPRNSVRSFQLPPIIPPAGRRCVGHSLNHVAETDLLVAYEPWQAHPVRFVLASVLIGVLPLFHDSSPPRMGCQKALVGCPRIQQWGSHRASLPSMGAHEGPAHLGCARGGKLRPHQSDCAGHKRRRGACSAQGER